MSTNSTYFTIQYIISYLPITTADVFQLRNKNKDIDNPCTPGAANPCNSAIAAPNQASPIKYPRANNIAAGQNIGNTKASMNGPAQKKQLPAISFVKPTNPPLRIIR